MFAQNLFFALIAVAMVFSAIKVVTTKNVVHAALFLVIVLAGVAGQFILLAAEFTAATQVLVYIGAVIVLFLFGVMLTQAQIGWQQGLDNDRKSLALGTSLLLFALLGYVLWDGFGEIELAPTRVQRTAEVSDSIFSTYIVPFEAVSVLLLAALIGSIVVARRE